MHVVDEDSGAIPVGVCISQAPELAGGLHVGDVERATLEMCRIAITVRGHHAVAARKAHPLEGFVQRFAFLIVEMRLE